MRNTLVKASRYLFSPRIVNVHNMPVTGPCFIYGNHANYFDPFLINSEMTYEPTAGVMTRDQFHKPIPRLFMDSIGIVPTSKYVPEPGIVRQIIKMIDQRRMIVIFPEGGRRWDGKPKPVIQTTLKLFWKMDIPVHPVQIHGSYLGWPRWADHLRKSSVELRFLDPMIPSDYNSFETFCDICKKHIDFDEYNPPEGCYPVSCRKPASGVHRLLYRCPDTGVSGAVFSPDGIHVYSRESTLSYKMDIHSRLVDLNGEKQNLITLYDKINSFPIQILKKDIILEKSGTPIYEVDDNAGLIYIGRGIAELKPEMVTLASGSTRLQLPLTNILYTSVEQNHKLTITTQSKTFQINLEGDSALQWQLYIKRLKKGEKPVRHF